mmetsp:Transcript_16248/g.26502  ORF Transcript_16248/g.26502 Transcript_16248/m.26502 type:complete len:80 (-) Transcript_16248:231-470(-)
MSWQYFEKAIEDGLFNSVEVAETGVEDAVVEVVDVDMKDEAAEVVELLDSDSDDEVIDLTSGSDDEGTPRAKKRTRFEM